jgi:hypothetical protein
VPSIGNKLRAHIWSSHSGIDEELSLLGYLAVSIGKYGHFGGAFCLYLQCQHRCKPLRPRNGMAVCPVA